MRINSQRTSFSLLTTRVVSLKRTVGGESCDSGLCEFTLIKKNSLMIKFVETQYTESYRSVQKSVCRKKLL